MKVKTLLPILGLTSVAVATPIITSCAQAPKEKEKVVLDRWTYGGGRYTVRTKEYMDINTITQYTFNINWLRFPPVLISSLKIMEFHLDHPSNQFDEDSINIEIDGVRYQETNPDDSDIGYCFRKDVQTPIIRIFNYKESGFGTKFKANISMKFKSPLKQVSPAITLFNI